MFLAVFTLTTPVGCGHKEDPKKTPKNDLKKTPETIRTPTAESELPAFQLSTARMVADGPVWSVAFSPNGKILASGGGPPAKPGELKLWDVQTGAQQAVLNGH